MSEQKYIRMDALKEYPFRRDNYDREHGNRDFITGIESVMEFADYLPTYSPAEIMAKQWVPVAERLPEDDKTVLCWYEYYHWSKEKVLPEYGLGYYINGRWGGEVSNGRDAKVLYWMPLPHPPKEADR